MNITIKEFLEEKGCVGCKYVEENGVCLEELLVKEGEAGECCGEEGI